MSWARLGVRTWIVGLVTLLALNSGCGEDEETGGDVPDPRALIAVASDVSLITVLALQAQTLAEIGLPPITAPAPADTVLPGQITCPLVEANPGLLGMDFGAGCTSDLDGTLGIGAVSFMATADSTLKTYRLLAEIQNFSRDGRNVDGDLDIEDTGFTVNVNATLLTMSGAGPEGILSGFLSANRSPAAGIPAYCTAWSIDQGLGAMDIGNIPYNFDVTESLFFSTCCAYPTRGQMRVTSPGLPPALLDFGEGTCDNLAILTVGGETDTSSLGYSQ